MTGRRIAWLLGGLLGAASIAAALSYYFFQSTTTLRIDDRLHVVLGGGGNSSILLGDEGVLLVDTKFLRPGRRLAGIVAQLTDQPVRAIINTHYHRDHTHGNPHYPDAARVIAQRRTRAHLIELDKRFWQVEPAWSALPQELVDDTLELVWGDETVRVLHLGRGHTDGDVVVHFVHRRLLQTGDLFVHGVLPRVDLKGGGSARAWLVTLDHLLQIDGVDTYLPGHGPPATRADVVRFRSYLESLVRQVEQLVAGGKDLNDVQAAIDLHDFDDLRGIPFFISRAGNVAAVYEEITGRRK